MKDVPMSENMPPPDGLSSRVRSIDPRESRLHSEARTIGDAATAVCFYCGILKYIGFIVW